MKTFSSPARVLRSAFQRAFLHIGFFCLASFFAFLFGAAAAAPYERIPVSTVKPLLLAALANGESHGVLVGEIAQSFREKFQSTSPINVDVRVMQASTDCNLPDPRQSQICKLLVDHALAHPGCKRLLVTTTQTAVLPPSDTKQTVAQSPTDQRLTYQINFCADGRLLEPINQSNSAR